jgi:hypothetical protein
MRGPILVLVVAACGGSPTDTPAVDAGVCATTGVTGTVTSGGNPITGARVTVEDTGGGFSEVRSAAGGGYSIALPAGIYTLGVSARGLGYVEREITVTTDCATQDVSLGLETEPGRWEDLGDPGDTFGGTNSGVLLPDGRMMFCHDTMDPLVYDPTSGAKSYPEGSGRIQGCHAVTLRPDGKVMYVGGADQPVYGPGTPQVKTFDPVMSEWTIEPELKGARWYPSMVALPDGELLTVGGGGVDNPLRVNTAELMDPVSREWTLTDEISIGNEVSPIVLLYTGEVLMTHRPPQLFNPSTKQWRLAGDFIQGDRMANGDHADHELQMLADGTVVAIGFKTFTDSFGSLLELYDPSTDMWRLGASLAPIRSRASTVQLPDGRIVVMGGYKEEDTDSSPVNEWNELSLTDLYDPPSDSWRRLANMNVAREYHAMPVLAPDGRVIIVGGEGSPGNEPAASRLEAFSPPYLFRGPRPEIVELSDTELRRGDTVTFRVRKTARPTKVVLVGTNATTHFMDSGILRNQELEFTQTGDTISASIPSEPARAVFGWYILFVLVDDIPSRGTIVVING